MVGSKRWFRYVDDLGVAWKVERDESLTEQVNETDALLPPNVGVPILSRGIEPRTLRYNSSNGLGSKSITLLSNTTAALEAAPTFVNDATTEDTYYLTAYIGERQRFSASPDTRQTDGDVELAPTT